MIANLDNEVYFKHVFTDVEVFKEFVKDVLGLELNIKKVETEKVLLNPVSAIRFRMDLFAEDVENRTIVEIQKVDYDYSYDRFSHYFMANMIDVQRSSEDYSYEKDVYVIVVMTSSYRINEKNGLPIKDDVFITDKNSKNLSRESCCMQDRNLLILNTKYINEYTSGNIKNWLDLIRESKVNKIQPRVNLRNKGIAKVLQLAKLENITPEQIAEAKIQSMRKATFAYVRNQAYEDGLKKGKKLRFNKDKIIRNFLRRGKLSLQEIAEDFDVSVDYVQNIQSNINEFA